MRLIFISTALMVSLSGTLFAQEWIEYASREDRFTCNFPGQPKVTAITYQSQIGAELPARVYSASQGQSRYSVTVVDYTPIQRILTERAKSCPAGAEPCLGAPGDEGHWRSDRQGALVYAAWRLMQRDAKVTAFVWNTVDRVEGHQLQLTNNSDKSRTFAGIYMHENKLYIVEGTVPAGYPEPGLFQQSLGWLDEKGVGLRYESYYYNGYPSPRRVNQRRIEEGQGRIDAPGAVVVPGRPR
ncbi:MAG: hypothetical protein EXQ47_11735 [Bryobacterales bacterium]|nr:hypothetical protein [Bryobacterales bacterium]